jgi:hypothetical protein
VEEALSAGFLWVISSFLTFLSPAVIASPLLSSANTAAAPPVPVGAGAGGVKAAGGGGGGGGGGPGAALAA